MCIIDASLESTLALCVVCATVDQAVEVMGQAGNERSRLAQCCRFSSSSVDCMVLLSITTCMLWWYNATIIVVTCTKVCCVRLRGRCWRCVVARRFAWVSRALLLRCAGMPGAAARQRCCRKMCGQSCGAHATGSRCSLVPIISTADWPEQFSASFMAGASETTSCLLGAGRCEASLFSVFLFFS